MPVGGAPCKGQGDIVKLIDGSGNAVVEYVYDSWGKPLSCTGTLATTLGVLNPFRYRGYVYDEETQWYYLRSRYYDPETCRFISADVLLSTGQGVLGHNCYAYCRNNPISRKDKLGMEDNPINAGETEDEGNGKTESDPIPDQHNNAYQDLPFGCFGNLDNNGCLVYAIYNAVCSKGYYFIYVYNCVMSKQPAILFIGNLGGDPIRMSEYIRPFGTATRLSSSDDFSGYDAVIFLIVYTIDIPCYDGSIWGISSKPVINGGHYYAGISNGDGLFTFYNGPTYNSRINSVHDEINQLSPNETLLGIWGIKLK